MLRRATAAALFTLAVCAAASAQDVKLPQIEFGRYHALVIGNNDYAHLRKLTTAVGDADAVATLLEEKYGFLVTKLTNATRLDITGALNRLRQTLTEKDNLLVYYAGHGVLDEEAGAGYWQPVDARPDDDSNWFSNARLTNYLKAMSARHVMVVADSCYSGNLTRAATSSVRSGVERDAWTRRMNARRSRTALTSGGLEPVLDRGGGGHSVFARAFLTALEANPEVLFGEELFDRVKGRVVANADQTPEYSDIRYTGDEKGDFLFVPLDLTLSVSVESPSALVPMAKPDPSVFELTIWRSVQNSDDPAMFEEYLRQYPAGRFAGIAKLKIKAAAKAEEAQTAAVGAAAPTPKVPVKPRHPYDGKYVGRVRREWYSDRAGRNFTANCPHMRMEITVTDGILKGVATAGKFSVSTEKRNKGFHMKIVGHIDEKGRSVGVTAKFFWGNSNFSSVEFFGNWEKGEWREVSGACGGVYELRKVE